MDNYQPQRFHSQIEGILKTIIDRRIALEINTSGLRAPSNRPYPHPDVIRWYYELGGRLISLGSDAHRVEDLGAGFDAMTELLSGIGFTEYHTWQGRQVKSVALK